MENNAFSGWEKVFAALDGDNIAGYCTLAQNDCISNVEYTPYIGFIFVGEQYRGKRLSEKMILFAMDYSKKLNFNNVYIVSDHINLYEKYGFAKIDEKEVNGMGMQKVYVKMVS
jgi:predicted GNAT family N-acyltransferase